MKRANKYLSLALALIMALSLCVTSFAANIEIENAVVGEEYGAYKIFDYTKNGTAENATAFSYTIDKDSQWFEVIEKYGKFTLTPSATDPSVYVVTFDKIDAADLAKYLFDNRKGMVADQTTLDGEFTELPLGYYFVDTTLGSLCSLVNIDTTQKLTEKNTVPTMTKTVVDETVSIGDKVTFKIVINDGKGTNRPITLHDNIEAGLTIDFNSFKVNGVDIAKVDNVALVQEPVDGHSFDIEFTEKYTEALEEGKVIEVTYEATLNENAEVVDADTKTVEENENVAWITYSKQESVKDNAIVKTFQFKLDKVDGESKRLDGAKFRLYDAETEGNEIAIVADGDNYRVAMEGEKGIDIVVGSAYIKGLEDGTYWLEEVEAPAGYNLLTARRQVVVENAEKVTEITVVNKAGGILPSTGGVGTTMFYVLGSVMMIGAAVLLVTKKKMANEQ